MPGWVVPPPREPVKGRAELRREREEKVHWLVRHGFLRSERIKAAMLKVRREDFIPRLYRDYAYQEVPLPLPGENATISCPHSYPLFYEALGLDEGHRLLEVGLGSGYGAAVAREIVGERGLVVSMEIDPLTFDFARSNLKEAGYRDIVLVNGDGGLGWPEWAPYDRICVTAACAEVPPPLVEQLVPGGRLAVPVKTAEGQDLVLLEKGGRESVAGSSARSSTSPSAADTASGKKTRRQRTRIDPELSVEETLTYTADPGNIFTRFLQIYNLIVRKGCYTM